MLVRRGVAIGIIECKIYFTSVVIAITGRKNVLNHKNRQYAMDRIGFLERCYVYLAI